MKELSERQDDLLVKAAERIKSHRKNYCPKTAVKHIPHWKGIVKKELKPKRLATLRKKGEVIHITKWGWRYLKKKHPEIAERRRQRGRQFELP